MKMKFENLKFTALAVIFLFPSLLTAQQTVTALEDKFVSVDNMKFRDFNRNGELDSYEDFRLPIEQRAKDLLSRMTIEEKLAQLRCPWMGKAKMFRRNLFDLEKAADAFPHGLGEAFQISDGGAVINKEKAPEPSRVAISANNIQAYFINHTRLGIPVLFADEANHGLVVRHGTMFPSALAMSSSWNEALVAEVFGAVTKEARAIGTHRLLAPVLDVVLDPRWGRSEENMGEDPYLISRLGVSIVKAMQGNSDIPNSQHVAAMLKHLGAHGQPEGGSNAGPAFISERQLREVNFKPFKAAVMEGKALGVMACYNEISGIPSHANRWMLTDVLRGEWGFKGIINSDYNATAELKDYHRVAGDSIGAALLALKAGIDFEQSDNFMYSSLPEAIEKNYISVAVLDETVLRVLELKFRLGIFENPYIDTDKTAIVGSKEHRKVALEAARQSVILLKNDNGLLPLDRKKYKKIAVIGPNADACNLGGYSHIPKQTISPLQALKEKYNDVEFTYAIGCQLPTEKPYSSSNKIPREENLILIKEAVNSAKEADIIILMLGGNSAISREATMPSMPGDLANLDLLGEQNELIDSLKMLNKPMVAFVFSGPPVSFAHLQNTVHSIVQCWYLGQETGYAVAETLFGENNPSGKLTISVPRSAGHLPSYYYTKPTARTRGYHFDDISPLYPFGYGLSYTTYQYEEPAISKSSISDNENVTVSIDVTNSGSYNGEEIVQLYIRDKVSSITRPIKELKDFKRISLASGETKKISFTITPDKLKFYNIDMKEVVEPGEFDIMIGPSSQEFKLIKLTVK
jgi:beta-glucosidase